MGNPKDLNKLAFYKETKDGHEYWTSLYDSIDDRCFNKDSYKVWVDGYLYEPHQIVTAMNRFRKGKGK